MSSDQRHRFGFQTGSWTVHHRKLCERLASCTEWYEFEGRCEAWELLGGAGNVDNHQIDDPVGPYRAATLRRLDPAGGSWNIWWIDGRRPDLDPPMRGAFEADRGLFFGEDLHEGKPISVRFIWSELETATPRWEQAFSKDDGATWETNWVMTFKNGERN